MQKGKTLGKIAVHHLDSSPQSREFKSVALPIELAILVLWFVMEYCSSFLHFFIFNPL